MQLSLFNCILYSNQASIFILKRSSSQCRWKCEFSILSEYRQKLALIQIAVFQWKVNRLPGAPIGLWFKSLPQKIVHVSRKGARSTCKMVKIGNWGVLYDIGPGLWTAQVEHSRSNIHGVRTHCQGPIRPYRAYSRIWLFWLSQLPVLSTIWPIPIKEVITLTTFNPLPE